MHACNPSSTQEVKVRRSEVQNHLGLHSKFKPSSLEYMRPSQKRKQNKKQKVKLKDSRPFLLESMGKILPVSLACLLTCSVCLPCILSAAEHYPDLVIFGFDFLGWILHTTWHNIYSTRKHIINSHLSSIIGKPLATIWFVHQNTPHHSLFQATVDSNLLEPYFIRGWKWHCVCCLEKKLLFQVTPRVSMVTDSPPFRRYNVVSVSVSLSTSLLTQSLAM